MSELAQYLRFYKDLGFEEVFVREAGPAPRPAAKVAPPPVVEPVVEAVEAAGPEASAPGSEAVMAESFAGNESKLEEIRIDIGDDCRRCKLCEGRSRIVFGSGDPDAKLVFVGEGPGADEDAQGLPFVGRAGQLLTQMIDRTAEGEGIPIKRDNVYICNVVKCRPPGNRAPEPDEMSVCGQFLERQLEAIAPKAICVLGSTAAKALLDTNEGITKMRGEWRKWRDIPVMPTFHPSYLLRAYNKEAKRLAWEDLKKVLHFVYG
ncbi:MAG: uracil-DNA glycosylase [Bryobacterales bacterium]|nr:uracil-DNA glycosylase [Acidobacteriota bacterium]MCB9385121.1 uracil-DNA glycosylase [Bryobacterales bacterium]